MLIGCTMLHYVNYQTHRIHVWNIYQHLPHKWPSHVGKYTSTMDPMGNQPARVCP